MTWQIDRFSIFELTVSGPTTLVGGGTNRCGFRNSGPGDLRDKRFRGVVVEIPSFPDDLDAKSRPYFTQQEIETCN